MCSSDPAQGAGHGRAPWMLVARVTTTSASALRGGGARVGAATRRPAARGRAAAAAQAKMGGPPLPSTPLGVRLGSAEMPTLECWLDFACPFCAKFYVNFVENTLPKYAGELSFVFQHQVQPWHPQSTLMHEAAIATRRVGGDEAFWKFSAALYRRQSEFFDVNTWHESRSAIYKRLAALAEESAGVSAADVLALLQLDPEALAAGQINPGTCVTTELKWYVKFGRQTGIHVSPTTTFNGLVCDTSSGWTTEQWSEFLDPRLPSA